MAASNDPTSDNSPEAELRVVQEAATYIKTLRQLLIAQTRSTDRQIVNYVHYGHDLAFRECAHMPLDAGHASRRRHYERLVSITDTTSCSESNEHSSSLYALIYDLGAMLKEALSDVEVLKAEAGSGDTGKS